MSFILDALKKSENDRQRNSGPALFEVKVAAPRNRLPMWIVVIALLLVVNAGIVTWLVMRKPQATAQAAPAPQPAPVAVAPPPAAAPATTPTPVLTGPAPTPAAPSPSLADSELTAEGNPEDYEPAIEPDAVPRTEGFVRRGTESGLPTYEEAASQGQLPELRMDLHVFAPQPQERFVLINMQRLREGEATQSGVHVDSITSDGAVLSYRGTRFVLQRE